MALSRAEIQKKSDEKRGVKNKGFNLKIETIDLIKLLSDKTGLPQGEIISRAVAMYSTSKGCKSE